MKKVLLLGLVVGLVGCGKNDYSSKDLGVADSSSSVSQAFDLDRKEVAISKPTSNWTYEERKDEMRGIVSKFAMISSDNQVQFDFPYDGGSNLGITLRQKTSNPTEVIFIISKGQYSCSSVSDNCYASVKFDNKNIQKIKLSGTSDHSSDILFIENDQDVDRFIQSVLNSEQLIIELPFYQEGNKQFKFTLQGLKWELIEKNTDKNSVSNSTLEDKDYDSASIVAKAVADATAAAAATADAATMENHN